MPQILWFIILVLSISKASNAMFKKIQEKFLGKSQSSVSRSSTGLASWRSAPEDQPYFDPVIADCYLQNKGKIEISDCGDLVNDPIFMMQWYLVPKPENKFGMRKTVDLGIIDVWINYRYFGRDIVVVVFDDGMDTKHPDLNFNYKSQYGWDFCDNQNSPDPNPAGVSMSYPDGHGTLVAGVVAMEIDDGLCGVGVAPHVSLGAGRIVCHSIVPEEEAKTRGWLSNALTQNIEDIHITVNSYGSDRYAVLLPLGIPYGITHALQKATTEGREGLGTIHVFPSGNDSEDGFTCAFDEYVNNIYTIVVAATSPWGEHTPYSSSCAAIMVSVPSSTTLTDLDFFTTENNSGCTSAFGGTSATVPLASGMIALTFNANWRLTWRDVQHLLVHTSSRDQIDNSSFIKNGAGLFVSHHFGFGLMNAMRMVEAAFDFETVPTLHTCSVPINLKMYATPVQNGVQLVFPTDGCKKYSHKQVKYLEHVQLKVDMDYKMWSKLHIDLISPSRTVAHLLIPEPNNNDERTNLEWIFDSVMTWGESPKGVWEVKIYDEDNFMLDELVLGEFELTLFGTKHKPSIQLA